MSKDKKNVAIADYTQENAPTQYIIVEGIKYAYRKFGKEEGIPLVFFIHFLASIDDWDPALIDPLAERYPIILIDNKGVGGSEGTTPDKIEDMADDAASLIKALGYKKVNVLGFSIGGFIAQLLAVQHPDLVNKLVLAGTGHKGGAYISNIMTHIEKAQKEEPQNPRLYLFFAPTESSRKAGIAYIERLQARIKEDRVPTFSQNTLENQAKAIIRYGSEQDVDFKILKSIRQPTLIVNGNDDIMVGSINSFNMVQQIPNSKLVLWSDSGHGALYQYHDNLVKEIEFFL